MKPNLQDVILEHKRIISNNILKSFVTENDSDTELKYKTAVAIIFQRGKVLLGKSLAEDDRKGKLVFPGGGIEKGENPYKAAIRETKEESGVTVKALNLSPIVDTEKPQVVFVPCIYLEGDIDYNFEFENMGWYSLFALPKEEMYEQNFEILEKYFGGK